MAGRTGLLTDQAYCAALVAVREFPQHGEKITNSKLRSLTGLNCDQAIRFFNKAISLGELERRGKAGSTHYVLP